MMMDLIYQTPIGPTNNERLMDGFTKSMVFSDHIYQNVLKDASWDGFEKVKNDPRYLSLRERAKTVSSVESINNLTLLMNKQSNRTDSYIQDKKWICALLVRDVGAYMIFDDAKDIEEKFERMQRENNTLVYKIAAAEFGGEFIEPPEIIKKRVLELNEYNKNAQIIMRDKNGKITHTSI